MLIDNTYILACAIHIHIQSGANSPLNESNEELRIKQWCLCLHGAFPFFQDYAIKAEIICSYYHLSLEDKKTKNKKTTFSSTGKVERWREWCTRLDVCDRKLAKLLLDK